MTETIKQSEAVVWVQENGDGTAFRPFAVGEDGMAMTGKSIPVVGLTPVYGRDRSGNPVVIDISRTAPGDLPTATINIFEKASLTVLERMVKKKCPINFQLRLVECGVLDNPFIWDKVLHWAKGELTTYNPGDGPSLEYDGTLMQSAGSISFRHVVFVVRTSLSSLTVSTEQADLLSVAGISDEDCNECGYGYPGADQILLIACAADGAASPNVYVSEDGGSTWTVTDNVPFAVSEDADFAQMRPVGESTVRYIVGTPTTDAAAEAKISWVEASYGSLATTGAWNDTLLTSGSVGDVVTAMLWALHDRLYIATDAFEIYIDEQQGEDGTMPPSYSGSVAVRAFALSPDEKVVWAVGDTNFIARERNQSGTFEVRTGPTGGVNFSAVAVAGDGTLWAGNVQSVYKSIDNAGNAGNWSLLKDFGSGFVVKKIHFVGGDIAGGGDTNIVRVTVSSATVGQIWETIDGGNSWRQITSLSNDGYNDSYHSRVDDNLMTIVGNADITPLGTAHRLVEAI
jgi:hypothetical protein